MLPCFCARGKKEGQSAWLVEAVGVPDALKGVIFVRMVIEHNNGGCPAVYRNAENGSSSQLTNIDDVGGTASLHVKVLPHNLKLSRSFVSVGTTTCTSVVYRPSIELPFLNGSRAGLRLHQYNADNRGLKIVLALGMSILLNGKNTQAMSGDFPRCQG